jgi:hypothetical protein
VAGKSSQQPAQSGAGSQATLPEVQTRFTIVAPQLSFNFGTSDGWSYISAGIGQAKARVTTSAFVTGSGDTAVTTDAAALSTSLRAVNFGGGARWFTRRHLAISFDVRFHFVSDSGGETPIPRTTLAVVTAGMSLR